MTDDVVEAMARAYYEALGHSQPWATLRPDQKNHYIPPMAASIRALHERGGLVVARMPDERTHTAGILAGDEMLWCGAYNAALADVRAAAVEVK